ncbi:hypothetical protein V6N13_029875 [Hibiscus sabdariffa]
MKKTSEFTEPPRNLVFSFEWGACFCLLRNSFVLWISEPSFRGEVLPLLGEKIIFLFSFSLEDLIFRKLNQT